MKTRRIPAEVEPTPSQPAAFHSRVADARASSAELPPRQLSQRDHIHQLRSTARPGHHPSAPAVAQLGGAFSRPAGPTAQNRGIDPLRALELKQKAELERKKAEALKQKQQELKRDAKVRKILSDNIGTTAQYPGMEYLGYQVSEDSQELHQKASKLEPKIRKTGQRAENLEMYSGVFSGTVKHVPTESEGET